jgi:hypothetical protein
MAGTGLALYAASSVFNPLQSNKESHMKTRICIAVFTLLATTSQVSVLLGAAYGLSAAMPLA